jgi:hypothetical protein
VSYLEHARKWRARNQSPSRSLEQGDLGEVEAAPIAEARQQIGAVLIRSARFDREVWIAFSEETAAELQAEEAERAEPRPVLTPSDVMKLKDKSEETIRVVLDTLAVFPRSSRLVQ